MDALFNQFIMNLSARLAAQIPTKRFVVDWQLGQLRVPEGVRPSVPHRSILVDIDASYETKQSSGGARVQWANLEYHFITRICQAYKHKQYHTITTAGKWNGLLRR